MIVQCGNCTHIYELDQSRDLMHVFVHEEYFDHVATRCPACQHKGHLYLELDQVHRLAGNGFVHVLHAGWVPMILQGYAVKQRQANAKRLIPVTNGVRYS